MCILSLTPTPDKQFGLFNLKAEIAPLSYNNINQLLRES